jgi:hypothetical protein
VTEDPEGPGTRNELDCRKMLLEGQHFRSRRVGDE